MDSAHPEGPLGFIGTGNIASAVVEGLCTSGRPTAIVVSPRNEAKARALEARFAQVRRAGSNQEVLDACATVVLAVRPGVAAEVLGALRFRPGHTVLSLIPTLHREPLARLVSPAQRVFKVLPLPYVARHLGLVPFFPADARVAEALRPLGEPMPLRSERELHLLWAVTGLISPFYGLLETIQEWGVGEGADPATCQRYTASMFACLAALAEGRPDAGFQELATEAATPGGLNEMALRMMREGTAYPDLTRALEAILGRFGEASARGTTQG
jgi:pyrroline-5-carboxylate reductase